MSELPSGLSAVLFSEETVARFITSSSWVAQTISRVKHPAFLPAPDNDTSVFRSSNLEADALWDIGLEQVGRFHGAAIVSTSTIRKNQLDVIPHEPPMRHANIRGWPCLLDPELQKAERKKIAMAIAEESKFLINPRPVS